MYCLQPVTTGPVPTAIDWYNPQGQLVSRDGGDEVNQAGAGRAVFLNFRSYQQDKGGKYECRVTGPGNYSEKLLVCIGECYTLVGCRFISIKLGRLSTNPHSGSRQTSCLRCTWLHVLSSNRNET